MESLRNNEDPAAVYRKLIQGMENQELEEELNNLREVSTTLGHSETFSTAVLDLTSKRAFVSGVNDHMKMSEVEMKIQMIEKELEQREMPKAA